MIRLLLQAGQARRIHGREHKAPYQHKPKYALSATPCASPVYSSVYWNLQGGFNPVYVVLRKTKKQTLHGASGTTLNPKPITKVSILISIIPR